MSMIHLEHRLYSVGMNEVPDKGSGFSKLKKTLVGFIVL